MNSEPVFLGAPARAEVRLLFAAYALLYAGTGALQQVTIPLLQQLRGWSADQCYWVMPTTYFCQAASRLPAASMIRVLGGRAALRLGGASFVVAALALTLAPEYWMVIVGMALWGIGSALFWAAGASHLLVATEGGHYGKGAGHLFASIDIGFIVGVPALSLICARAGYQWAAAFSVPATVVGLAVLCLVRPRLSDVEPASFGAFREALRQRWGLLASGLLFVCAFSFGVTLGIVSEHTAAQHGIGSVSLIAGFYVARLVVNLVGGRLSDRLGRARVLSAAFGVAAGGAVLAALNGGTLLTVPLSAAALGIVFSAVPTTSLALVGDHVAERRRPVVYGSLFIWRDVGIATSILLGHYLGGTLGGFREAMLVFAAVWAALAVLGAVAGRRRVRGAA